MKFIKVEIYNQTKKFMYINPNDISFIAQAYDVKNNEVATSITFRSNQRMITVMGTPEEILGLDLKGKLDALLE